MSALLDRTGCADEALSPVRAAVNVQPFHLPLKEKKAMKRETKTRCVRGVRNGRSAAVGSINKPLATVVALVLGLGGLGACEPHDEVEDVIQVSLGESNEALYVHSLRIWPTNQINVCWEQAGNAVQKRWVQEAVAATWETETAVDFQGWGVCTPASRGLRIRVADAHPHVTGLGTELDGRANGMVCTAP